LLTSIHSKIFINSNGRRQVFIAPKDQSKATWNEAKEICSKFNSELVEIESDEKQKELEQFLKQVISEKGYAPLFWLNSGFESGKFKWLGSHKELNFTNWFHNIPTMEQAFDRMCIYTPTDFTEADWGKWINWAKDSDNYVVCEIDLFI